MYLQAAGPRYLCTTLVNLKSILWSKSSRSLDYYYYYPVAKSCSADSLFPSNQQFDLGKFSRKEREKMLKLAEGIEFSKRSAVNGCRVWTRDLLEIMVREGLISEQVLKDVR